MAHYVLWVCDPCGYQWDGLSPADRSRRPVCPSCGNGRVKVARGYVDKDKEKWKNVRKSVLERDNYTCHKCGEKFTVEAPVFIIFLTMIILTRI